jgi:hypothetical protein
MAENAAPRSSADLRTIALALAVDTVTAEVVAAMRAAEVRPLLLKGPSIAAWLYADSAPRPYADSDLLVSPESWQRAEGVLHELGFRPVGYPWPWESRAWLRRSDRATVDLHRSLVGAVASPEAVWEALAASTETLRVGGAEVEVLGIPARALAVALHAAQHGLEAQPLEDLRRALRIGDEKIWREAGEFARRLQAVPAFAAGLRLDPDGAVVAKRLRLPVARPRDVALRAGSAAPLSVALERISSERSADARVRLFLRALVPSRLYMRNWSRAHMSGWPAPLRRGRLRLWLAYLWRPVWLLVRLPGALTALRRAAAPPRSEER